MTSYAPQGMNRALVSPLQIDDNDTYRQLFQKERRKDAFLWMKDLGMYTKLDTRGMAKNLVYDIFEETFAYKMAHTVSAQTPDGGSDDVDITIAAADHSANTGNTNIILQQRVEFPNGTQGFVSAIDRSGAQDVITVTPLNATQDVKAAAAAAQTAGDTVLFGATLVGEKSVGVESRAPETVNYSNQLTAFRAKFDVTDFEKIVWKKFTYKGQPHFYPLGIEQAADRFMIDIETDLLIGRKTDGTLTDADGRKITAGEGLIPAVRDAGGDFEYNPAATPAEPTLTTITDWVRFIRSIRGANNYFGLFGEELGIGWNNFLLNFTKDQGSGSASYVAFNGSKELAWRLNFNTFEYAGKELHWKVLDLLSDKDMLGGKGFTYSQSGIMVPAGDTRDPKQGVNVPFLQMKYAPHGVKGSANKGDFAVFELGMQASQGPTNDVANHEIHHYGVFGLEIRGRDKFIYMTPA